MVQSVELMLDDAADAALRRQWDRLAAAGLPSQGRHRGASNRPHVTVAVRDRIPAEREPALSAAVAGLPTPLRLGALACFGRRRYVLVRLVVADAELLALHARIATVLGPDEDPGRQRTLAPGRWTPHVTLARRLTAEQVGSAVAALEGIGESDAEAVCCRRWDGTAGREWLLPVG